jgi:hypothetical protein
VEERIVIPEGEIEESSNYVSIDSIKTHYTPPKNLQAIPSKEKFTEESTKPFIIQARINSHPARILIDSGADLDCISSQFVSKYHFPTQKHRLLPIKGADRSHFCTIWENTAVTLTLETLPAIQHTFNVATIHHDAILDTNWL